MGICAVGCRYVERVESTLYCKMVEGVLEQVLLLVCPFQYLEDLLFTSRHGKSCSVLSMSQATPGVASLECNPTYRKAQNKFHRFQR